PGLKRNRASMFLNNNVMRNGQTLAGALTQRLGGEERIEDAVPHFFRDSRACVADPDLGPLSIAACANFNPALGAWVGGDHVTDRVRGINDQVKDDLVKVSSNAKD